jgi:Domain of unknown function (DUF222)
MFGRLEEARRIMGRCAEELAPSQLSADEADRLVGTFAEIERLAGVCRALAAQRVAESPLWRCDGDRSPAHWLARRSGTSVHRAEAELASAEAAVDLPATDAALRSGALSLAQAAHVSRAAKVDPGAESDLLAMATEQTSMAELAREADRRESSARHDAADRYDRVWRARYFRHHYDPSGAFRGEFATTPDDGARLLAGLRPWLRDRMREVEHNPEGEPVQALMVDALVEAVSEPRTSSPADRPTRPRPHDRDVKVIVRIDHGALARGHTHPGETCEVRGAGPLPPSRVRQMIDGGAFVAAVLTRAEQVVGVAHLGRGTTAAQETALQWRDAECCVKGCPADGYLETDHRTGWAVTHETCVDDLDGFCSHHHRLKTNEGYRLDPGTGKRRMRPPPRPEEPP